MKKTLLCLLALFPMCISFCCAEEGGCCEVKWTVVSREKFEAMSQDLINEEQETILYSSCGSDCDCHKDGTGGVDHSDEG